MQARRNWSCSYLMTSTEGKGRKRQAKQAIGFQRRNSGWLSCLEGPVRRPLVPIASRALARKGGGWGFFLRLCTFGVTGCSATI